MIEQSKSKIDTTSVQPAMPPARPCSANAFESLRAPQVDKRHPRESTRLPTPKDDSSTISRAASTMRALATSFGSTVCYSFTGVFNQAARGGVADISLYPNPLLYCGLRSGVAAIATYLKDKQIIQKAGFAKSWQTVGPEGRTMCLLMGLNNALWVPAFMLTDLASAIVISCAQPFVHALYERIKMGKSLSLSQVASLTLTGAALTSITLSASNSPHHYPHALWGNLAAAAATACYSIFGIMNNNAIERAKRSAHGTEAQLSAQREAQERLAPVPFFSQLSASLIGFGLFVPFHSGPLLSGGLGIAAATTLTMACLQGLAAAGGLHLRARATQTTSPLVVSLIANIQVGLTPVLGYLIFKSTVPDFAILGGFFSCAASMVTIAEQYKKQKPAT